MSDVTIERGLNYKLHRPGLTLTVDTRAPGTDLDQAPRAQAVRWNEVGWGHFTLSRDDIPWRQPSKVALNGAFKPLAEIQDVVDQFTKGWLDWRASGDKGRKS